MSNIQTLSTQDPPSIVMSPQSTHQWSAHGLLHRVWARLTQRTPFNTAQGLSLDRGLNAAQQESRERRLPSVELIKVGGVYHVHDRRDPIARTMEQNYTNVELATVQMHWQNAPR